MFYYLKTNRFPVDINGISTVEYSNPSPTADVTFLGKTAFGKTKSLWEIGG
jgi:hypothetical protein